MPLSLMVRHGAHGGRERAPRRGRLPMANASLYAPAANRSWWWISLRCPHCGSVHLGRVRTEAEAGGPRRTGCGRKVFVKVRRDGGRRLDELADMTDAPMAEVRSACWALVNLHVLDFCAGFFRAGSASADNEDQAVNVVTAVTLNEVYARWAS